MRALLAMLLAACLALGALPLLAEECAAPPAAATPAPAPEPEATPAPASPADGLVGVFLAGTAEQFDKLSELLRTQYPTLTDELVKFLFTEQPDLLTKLMPALAPTLARDYPEVPQIIGRVIARHDQLKLRVSEVIQEDYPTFETDLQQIPPGPTRHQQVAEMVDRKYPQLMGSLVDLLRQEFPTVLSEAWGQIEERYPNLIRDMALFTVRTFPSLTGKVINYVVHHYPQLLPQILGILNAPPAETPPPPPPAPPSP